MFWKRIYYLQEFIFLEYQEDFWCNCGRDLVSFLPETRNAHPKLMVHITGCLPLDVRTCLTQRRNDRDEQQDFSELKVIFWNF